MNLYLSLEPKPESLTLLRDTANNFFSNILESEAFELITVLNEAASNCILHAKSLFSVYLSIQYCDNGHTVVAVEVSDISGSYFDGNQYEPPVPGTCEGKMGIVLMRSMMDEIGWTQGKKGTIVKMSKTCALKNKRYEKTNQEVASLAS